MSPHHVQVAAVEPQRTAWKESSVYQIWPASFKDSTGSGTGDLKGVISKVDYLKRLGVDTVWLSPIFESPQVDMGYDISNYRVIDPQYGSIDDVDVLRDRLHERDMKLVMDLVMNHTSDQHEWFKQSRSSKQNKYRDWYIWKPARVDAGGNRQPPNNWQSHFQAHPDTILLGNAWTWDETTEEYYLHLYGKEQPDLNWENPAVRQEVQDTMRFWLDRGIDGFRFDVINFVSKDQRFLDSTSDFFPGCEYYACGPRLHEYLQELGSILEEYNAFSVGEMPCVHDPKDIIKSVQQGRKEFNMIFHFELMDIDHGPNGKFTPGQWSLADFKETVDKWQQFMYQNNGWNALYLENHDQPRAVSRFASDSPEHREQSAKLIAVFLGFQAGTPFIYQGQEIGMHNVPTDWPLEEYQDIDCLNHWRLKGQNADRETQEMFLREYQKKSRDNARTPVQWDSSKNSGFTSADKPWMSVNPNYTVINAAAQLDDPNSVFNCWRTVLDMRKQYKDIVVYGRFDLVDQENDNVFAYTRNSPQGQVLVVCNFSPEHIDWTGLPSGAKEILVTTTGRSLSSVSSDALSLEPFEAISLLVKA
ncbi:Alpha-glucosidase [Penicillium diatomitis]|uniref:Alpha-glucosidase n=1 Tax=Penicillium diatomitis TaxID=2819901 RepID=A0A9W9XIB6_9EURO|nr:Alpha-glucosidase [Penicillium diatomitis]KAJ5493512.1 Alpha-glucosidase [Penicillium diatomitis]